MTNDKSKTKAQLLDEIVRLKKQIRDDHSRVLFENTPLPYQSLDKEGNILAVNTAWIELLGYEKEKVIGRFIGDFLVPDHAKVLKENFLDFVTSGKMNHADFTMIKRDGSRILITIKGRIGYDELGNFSQTHCLLHDLTEQRRAEKELSASEQRFRGLFESSIDGIFHVDTFGSILNVNPAFCAILGFVSDDLLGKNIIDITPRKWYSVEKKIFREKVMPDGYSEEFEKEYLHKDGHPVPVTTRIWLTRDEEGAPIGSWGVVRDLTSQKDVEKEVAESEQQLRESENSLRVLLTATVDSVGLFSLEGTILIINQNMADSMGHSIEDLIGQNIFKYFSRKVVKKWKINFDMAAKSNTPQFMKEVYSGRIIDSVTYPILGESGEVSSLAVYAKDVTDTILSEQAQKQSDERYRRIVETADEGIIGFDANQCITYANQITVDFFGYELEETVGASLYDLLLPEDIGAYKKRMEQRARGERERYEQRFVRKDGEMVWGLVSATPILAEDGHYLGSFAMITDITERKKTEEALNLTQFSVDRASIDIYWINADGRFVYANDHACESLGYTLEELLTMTVPDINPYFLPEGWPGYWFERRQYGIKQFETVHQRKDGSQFPVGITSHYWRYGDQDYLFTYSYDLSERKQAEEKLKHSQELLNEVQRISLTGGWEVDMLTRETIWTNGQFQLHGLEPGVVPADIKRFFEFYVHPADQTKLAEAWQTVITKHTAVEVEYRSIKADGIESVLVVVATPDVDKTGKLRRVFGSTRDVTKERQAAQDLKQAHERLLTILDGIDADVYVSDLETHEILFMNAHMREYFGSPTKDVPCHKVFRGETEPCPFCPKPSLLDAQGNPVGTVIGERYSPLTKRWYLDHDRVIEWLEGKQVHMHMAADITEIKTMAEDLKLAMGEAQAASIAKNEFQIGRASCRERVCLYV